MILSEYYYNLYTSPRQSYQILLILKKYTKPSDIIVDATAGMGGNTINFCKYYSFVFAIEILDNCINYINSNLNKYNNKLIINGDCLEILKIIKTDIIFFDPPWGGKEYKNSLSVILKLNGIPIHTIIDNYYKYCKVIAMKAPNNYIIQKSKLWTIKENFIYKNEKPIFKFIIYYKNNKK